VICSDLWMELFDTRHKIALSHMEVNEEGWDFMFTLVDMLGVDGMSLDKSEVDEDRKRCYWVKRRAWRTKGLEKYLRQIDRDRNVTNAYRNAHSGTFPQVRKCPAYNDSTGEAIRGLPKNLYES
jgi:hypothetical protein